MSEVVDKIYCDNNCAETMALMNNNNWSNNPFMYLIWLAFFGNNGFGNKNQDSEVLSRLNNLQSQITDNQSNSLAMDAINGNREALSQLAGNLNVGVTSLNAAISNIQNAINNVATQNGIGAEKVVNSVLLGNKDLVQQIASCCCENKQLVTTMGYEGQLRDQTNTAALTSRIDQLANGITQGFASVGYETSQQTNALQNSLQNQTQTIIDKISNLEANAQQDKINSLTAQLTAANARAERQAELSPIIAQLNAIKSAQPATATITYPNLVAYPSYLNGTTNTFWN